MTENIDRKTFVLYTDIAYYQTDIQILCCYIPFTINIYAFLQEEKKHLNMRRGLDMPLYAII